MQISTIIIAATTFSMAALASPVELSPRTGGTSITPAQCTADGKVQKCCDNVDLLSKILAPLGLGSLIGVLGIVDAVVGSGCSLIQVGGTCTTTAACCNSEPQTVTGLVGLGVDLSCLNISL